MKDRKNFGYINKKGQTKVTATIVLSVAVLIALLLLGMYAWRNREEQPDEDVNTNPTIAAVTMGPTITNTPTQPPTPTVEPTALPTVTSTPAPTPKPSVTPIPKLDFEPVKALYLRPKAFQDAALLDHYIDLANRTEVNSYVIDIKSDWGMIQYTSGIEDAQAANACLKSFDLRNVIKKLHDNDIRVIGRLVTFKDSIITKYKPELAIHHNGALFDQSNKGDGVYWLDPTNKDSWDYILEIVKEVINFGIDEIQFDYVRFPESNLYQYELLNDGKERSEYIEDFLAYIRKNVPEGTILSADVFGMPLISTRDYGEIGQTLETIGWNIDYISPMIYPSHFANGAPKGSMSNGVGQVINGVKFTHPDLQPYEVVYNTLMVGKKRMEAVEGYQLKCRAYIQGFTATYLPTGYWKEYGVEEFRAQIQAVYDAGFEEWIFWNASNNYVEEAFLPKE
ncbi:MAG TPA: putative glycoside hydrolase [Thermoclostridium sp.]|nr:putative glycoside hydrolase [Thermoclostridium sp.]